MRTLWLAVVYGLTFGLATGLAQQRPPEAERPKPIPDHTIDARLSLGWENRAVYPLSGLEGEHISLFPISLTTGIGDRAEFKMEGTVQDFLKPSTGKWRKDFGDVSLSAKILLFEESGARPAIAIRNAVFLPNANQASGLGTNTFRFFTSLIVGKTANRTAIYGSLGTGILADPTNAVAQQDVLTGNLGVQTSLSKRFTGIAAFNGMHNPRNSPAPGTNSRAEVRLGLRLHTDRLDWDLSTLGGLTRNDPRFGVTISVTKRFTLSK